MRQTNTKTKTRKSTTEERTKKNYQSGYEMRMKMRLAFVLTLITFVIIVYDHFFRDTERTFGCIFFAILSFVQTFRVWNMFVRTNVI